MKRKFRGKKTKQQQQHQLQSIYGAPITNSRTVNNIAAPSAPPSLQKQTNKFAHFLFISSSLALAEHTHTQQTID